MRSSTRKFVIALTPDEKDAIHQKLADNSVALHNLAEEKKSALIDFKQQEDPLKNENKDFVKTLKAGGKWEKHEALRHC